MNNKPEYNYIGRAKCGCIHAVTSDEGNRDTAKTVGEFIIAGLIIERVNDDYVRANFGRNCIKCNPPKPDQAAML